MFGTKIQCLVLAVAILGFGGSFLNAQPGDCNGDWQGPNTGDLVYLLRYLAYDLGVAVDMADCDCDANPGVTWGDALQLKSYFLYGPIVPFLPSPGPDLARVSGTLIYCEGRANGTSQRTVDIMIDVAPSENIRGFILPFSFAAGAWQATLNLDSLSFAGSVATAPAAVIDNANKRFILRSTETVPPPVIPGGTKGRICRAYFSQVAGGNANDVLLTATDRDYPALFFKAYYDGQPGTRVFQPAFISAPTGDVDCDNFLNISDAVAIIAYIFSGGAICVR